MVDFSPPISYAVIRDKVFNPYNIACEIIALIEQWGATFSDTDSDGLKESIIFTL